MPRMQAQTSAWRRVRVAGMREAMRFMAILWGYRRRLPPPPPPLLRALLRLDWPRLLAARCDEPLEYPENASERPLVSARGWLTDGLPPPSPYPRDSMLPARSVRAARPSAPWD